MPTHSTRTARRRAVPVVIAVAATLLGAGGAATAGTAPSSDVTMEGTVTVTVAMLDDGTMKADEVTIVTDGGERFGVEGDGALEDFEPLSGQRVAITGEVSGDVVAVEHFHRIGSYMPAYSGAKRAAIIRIKHFTSSKPYLGSESTLSDMVFTGSNSLAKMWEKESRGKLTLSGGVDDVFSETLPAGTSDNCIGGNDGTYEVAQRHPGYDFYLFMSNVDCFGITGRAQLFGGRSWYFGPLDTQTLWHEMGHNLGFHHSNELSCNDGRFPLPMGPNCSSAEYGDWLTPLGNGGGACAYSAYQDIVADWDLPYTEVEADATVQLRARNLDGNGLPRALVVPGAPASHGGYYMLEWRTTDYPSCRSKNTKGLQIRVVGNAQANQHTHLVDMTPVTDGVDQTLGIGKTFRDPMTNMSITLVSQNVATGVADVQVKFDDPGPPPPPPPPTATVVRGQLRIIGDDFAWEGDALDVYDDGTDVIVSNRFPVTVSDGCVNINPTSARCSGVTKILIDGKWGRDVFTVQTMRPVDVNDTLGYDTYKAGPTPDGPVRFIGKGNYTIDYSARLMPLSITLDGKANDGAPGELDNIGKTVDVFGGAANDHIVGPRGTWVNLHGGAGDDLIEGNNHVVTLYGGPGNDTLRGTKAVEYLFGEDGNDVIEAGAGRDLIYAGPGNDSVNAKDGVREWDIDCGDGNDGLSADPAQGATPGDTSTNCEQVTH